MALSEVQRLLAEAELQVYDAETVKALRKRVKRAQKRVRQVISGDAARAFIQCWEAI